MSLKTAKSLLKVMGILSIIFAVLGLILAVVVLAGGSFLAATPEITADIEGGDEAGPMFIGVGIGMLISAVIELLDGIFSVNAAKDSSKYKPAWIFSLISLAASVITLILGIVQNGTSGILTNVGSICFAILIFIAANTIKKDAGN